MPTIQFRTDDNTKQQSSAIFHKLGLTMSDAINIFLHLSILHGGLPFEMKLPKYNAETEAAIADMELSKGKNLRGTDVHTVLAELKSNGAELPQ